MSSNDTDMLMRLEAFARVRFLSEMHGHLTQKELRSGFTFNDQRVPLVNPVRGIFKPRSMRYLLSIKTVVPRPGGRVWYDDQREAHNQIYKGDDAIDYAFMGNNPDAPDNQWLRAAYENRKPVIYFLGIAPGRYHAIVPVYVAGWDAKALKARIVFGAQDQQKIVAPQDVQERRYALRTVKQRLHQASFREAVISAYQGRCSLSGLSEKRLLDAAHIIPDANEQLGQPVVPNGLPLSKIHHAAFDAYLVGIDPDYRVHVSDRLLEQHDGKMLEVLKLLDGGKIHLPRRSADYPDRDRLAQRYELFRNAA